MESNINDFVQDNKTEKITLNAMNKMQRSIVYVEIYLPYFKYRTVMIVAQISTAMKLLRLQDCLHFLLEKKMLTAMLLSTRRNLFQHQKN